ncbi:MAG: hypothetical protein A2Z50_04180 [Nitrospirae bacterium RBG_19FT_COMBO_42_15]|nr:MAG: hypothetical protein A2Z50_04180 [Nitrospirae bacterium RBG_19FT_COMBO_42_15]
MIEAMRKANLEPPRLQDKRTSFWIMFRSHTLMGPEAVTWLNQFASLPLNDRQRLSLIYLRNNQQISNSDYQRLNHTDSVAANRELGNLVQAGLIKQHKTRRWAYYTLTVPVEIAIPQLPQTDEERIIEYVRKHGSINNEKCRKLLSIKISRAWYLLSKLDSSGKLKKQGKKRWARYVLP